MNNQLLSSKVLSLEQAARQQSMNAAQTGIPVFVGAAERGPLEEPWVVLSYEDYFKVFGGHGTSYTLTRAVWQFYAELQNQGAICYVSRTVHYSSQVTKTHAAAKGTLDLNTDAVAASAAKVTTTEAAPWFVQNGETLVGSVNAGADNTVTFAGASAKVTGNPGADPFPWTPASPVTILAQVGAAGPIQTLTISAQAYTDSAAVADEIQAQLQDAVAYQGAAAKNLVLETGQQGTGAYIEITGGTAATVLGLTALTGTGTGNVADLSAVTFAELASLGVAAWIEDGVGPDGVAITAEDDDTATIATVDTGAAASIQFKGTGTANARFGLDVLLHEGEETVAVATLRFTQRYFGAYGDDLKAVVAKASSGKASAFDLFFYLRNILMESHANLTMDDTDATDFVEVRLNQEIEDGGSVLVLATDLDATLGTPTLDRPVDVESGAFTGAVSGLTGYVAADVIGIDLDDGGIGMWALETVLDFDVLVLPEMVDHASMISALSYCRLTRLREVFYILSTPAGLTFSQMIAFVEDNGLLRHAYAEQGAAFWPKIKIRNPDASVFTTDLKNLLVDPAATIAGVMSRNDAVRPGAIYEQPAGEDWGNLNSATGLELLGDAKVSQVQREPVRDRVYPKLINPIWKPDGAVIQIDGHRCLSDAGDFGTIAERRGMGYVEKTIRRGLRVYKHRNNNKALRKQVRRSVFSFLKQQMDLDAFQYNDPALAFFVDVSDVLNNAQAVRERKLKLKIGVRTQPGIDWVISEYEQMLEPAAA